jgi:hypothetical protein
LRCSAALSRGLLFLYFLDELIKRWTMGRFFNKPELVEKAVVKMTMDGLAYYRLKPYIDDMGIDLHAKVVTIDTVKIDFDFTVKYYNIVDQFKALIILLNDPSVSSAMIGSREDLNLLFVELVDAIRSVQKTLEERVSQ